MRDFRFQISDFRFARGQAAISNSAGFTLLEMLVAMVVLAIGIVGVLGAFSASTRTYKDSETYSVAAMLAQQAASELERRPDLQPGRYSGTFSRLGQSHTWQAEVEKAADSGLQRVAITVFWQEGKQPKRFQMLTCLRPGYELQPEEPTEQPASSPGGST